MPWTEVSPLNEKMLFVTDWIEGFWSFSELCRRHFVSRKAGRHLIERFVTEGKECFQPRSRMPHHCPHRTAANIEALIIKVRKATGLGAKKILWWLKNRETVTGKLPQPSTVCNILKRHNCVRTRRPRIHRAHPGRPLGTVERPNELWTADFKGQFKTMDGIYCYPLTVADSYSRNLLACDGMLSPCYKKTQAVFKHLFQEYGLPERIRTDNGTPFASSALGRISRLSIWWIRLGILPELIQPGCPQQNGQHERMHRTLKQQTAFPPAKNCAGQQQKFNNFIRFYNNDRPHEAIGMCPPAVLYRPSNREMPDKLAPIEYPVHYEVRLVSTNGGIKWNNGWVNVSQVLGTQYVGLEEIADGICDVYFGPVWLGRLDVREMRIEDDKGRTQRRKEG